MCCRSCSPTASSPDADTGIEVILRGRRQSARAVLVDDPDTVAAVYQRLIAELGVRQAQRRLGIQINSGEEPSLEEPQDAVRRSGLSIIQIDLTTRS